jgi:hypothetical protein
MKTRGKAIAAGRKMLGADREFCVYQFPRGHWGYASLLSPVGEALQCNGMFYPEIGVAAQCWEVIR